MFSQIFDKLISDSESVRTMFDQLFEFSIRYVKVMNALTGRDDSSDISIEQLRSEKPTEPISYCPDFSIYTWDVEKVLKYIHDVFTEHKYPIYTFPIYLETHVEEIIKVGISDKPSNICLAALKYISVNPYHVALRTLNVDSEVFRESIEKCEHLEEILDVMVSFNTKLMGTNETFKDKFIHSLQQIIKLQNTWEYIKICNINNKLEGDKTISEDRLFDIYGGDYSQIPKSTRIIETDIDMTTITQTDDKRVNSFIYQNFNRFCDLLESYGKTVYKVLNNSNENDFTKEIGMYNSKLDYYNLNSKSLIKIFTHISSIKDKHIVYGLKDVIDVIIYNYVPELRKLKFNKYFDESLAISMITSGGNSMLLGVALYIPSIKIREQTKESSIKNKVITGGGNTETDGVNSELLSATNKFNEYGLSFINSFISNYKKIINKLGEIDWNTLKVKADTRYKNSFVLLRKLLIKKPETLSKLIDIDENDNFNYEYTKACNEFVSFIKNNQLSVYTNITNEVEALSELLSDIHKKAINFRNDTFNIKKNKIDFDYLSMYTIKLQRELNLKIKTEFDKEKVEEKIDKIVKYTLSSLSSLEYPYDISKNKEKLEEYLSKIKDRESTIKEYFETLRHDCKYSYQQLSPRVKNLVITFCNIYNSLVNEYEKSYLWLNNEFDKFITKDRIKQLDKITLTTEQIKSIVSAAEQIDKYKPINNIAEQFDNYVSSMMDANVTDFYKCYQFVRNAYEEIGVLNYIEIIYKTLDIVDTSSKEWYTFKSNLLNFLTINSIWFDIYKLDKDKNRYVLSDKDLRVEEFGSKDYKLTELERFSNNFEFFNIVNNMFSNKLYNKNSIIIYNNIKYTIPFKLDDAATIKGIIKNNMDTAECCDVIRFLFEVMENLSINDKDSKFKFGYAINDKSIFKPFNKELDTRIFKALYVPIFQKINKYIILNKSEDDFVFDDKIMLTMLGGAKQYGSSLYDYSEPHKVEDVKFIEDYLPIYVSCYTIINYYVSYLNDLMKNSKLLSIDTLFKCSILNSIIDKTPEGFKVKEINVINVDKYLKFINDICSKNKKKDTDLTKFAIESISSEFNSMLTLSKSLKSNELKSVDLYSEFDNLTNITDDIRNVIDKMRELYINNGFNYSIEYKNLIERLREEMKVTSDKKAFFINCIEKLEGKYTNDTFNTKKVFIDLYYTPLEIISNYWVNQIKKIKDIQGTATVQKILYKLYLMYGNKYHNLKELYTCIFDEFYKDLDECIHHIINYKNFNDNAVEKIQMTHNEIKNLAMKLKTDIDQKFKDVDYKINDKMIPYIPFIGNPIVKKREMGDIGIQYFIEKNIGAVNHSISFEYELYLGKITITDMIINFIASITQENTIPLRMVELLKNSELNNNTFKLFPISDKSLFWSKDYNINTNKGNIFQDDIIGAFSSIIIHKSLYNNDLGTDVNSQVYCNKLLSIINFSIYTLETMLNGLIPGKEYYNSYVHSLDATNYYDDVNDNTKKINIYDQTYKDVNNIIVPKINAKKEINILINILKELYSYYAPRAKECEFLGGNILNPDHYIVELIKIFNSDNDTFKKYFMNNIEKYQWVIPTLKKIDYDIKYNDPFEKYFKNINNMDKLIEKKDHMHIMKILAKLILYKFLNIHNLLNISEENKINTALMGGRLVNHTTELNDKIVYDNGRLGDFINFLDETNNNKISISKDIYNPLQYVLNDDIVMKKLNINSNKNEFLYGDNEYIASKVYQIIVSDNKHKVRRINVKCNRIERTKKANMRRIITVKFNNGTKRSYYTDVNSDIYEILFDYDINSDKIIETNDRDTDIYGNYKYNYKNIKDLYEYIKSNNNEFNTDYNEFINELIRNKDAIVNNHKFGLNKLTMSNKNEFLWNIVYTNDDLYDSTMMNKISEDKLILDTINERKLWLISISVLMLYCYYGIWSNKLLDKLIILSKKIINLYNDKYKNSNPHVFINELIKNKFINCVFDNINISIPTYDLIELDTYYNPKISSIKKADTVNNLILKDRIKNLNNVNLNTFENILIGLNYICVEEEDFNIDEDIDNMYIDYKEINSDDYIEYINDDTYKIIYKGIEKTYELNLNYNIDYVYKWILKTLTNIISCDTSDKKIFDHYIIIKTLYRIFIILYCYILSDKKLISDYNELNKDTFIMFHRLIQDYKSLLEYRYENANVKDETKVIYERNKTCLYYKKLYKIFKSNNINIDFKCSFINPKEVESEIKMNFEKSEFSTTKKYIRDIEADDTDYVKNKITMVTKIYSDIINNNAYDFDFSELINKLKLIDLVSNNVIRSDNISSSEYTNIDKLLLHIMSDNNMCTIYNYLCQISREKNVANIMFAQGYNFNVNNDSEEKDNIEILFGKLNALEVDIDAHNNREEKYATLRTVCKALLYAINYIINVTIYIMTKNIVNLIKNSRELHTFFKLNDKCLMFPYDNITNANYNIALDNIYRYFDLFDINDIKKSINNINKNIFTLMKDSQVEIARKKMNILLSSSKHINSLKNINNKKVIYKINYMYLNRNLSIINLDLNIRGPLRNNITNVNDKNKDFKDYYSSKWYLRGLSNNNIVIKTMIEILLENMDLNVYKTTYQLHPFNNNIPLIPLTTDADTDNLENSNDRSALIYLLGNTYCDNNIYYLKDINIDYKTICDNYDLINSFKTLLLSPYLMMTYSNINSPDNVILIDELDKDDDNIIKTLMNNGFINANVADNDKGIIKEKTIYDENVLDQITSILFNGNMSGGDLVLEDPNTILEKFTNEKHTIFDKYIFRYNSDIKNIILGHFANILASYSNYLSGLTYYQILYSSEVFDTFVKSIRETFNNNNVKVQNSEISCIYHVINSLLSDEYTERVKLPMISSVNTVGNELNNSNFIQDNIVYPFINKRKFFDMKSKDETLLTKLIEYDSKCLIDKMVDIEFYNMAVNCILIYIIKYVYNNRLSDDTINYIDNEVSL